MIVKLFILEMKKNTESHGCLKSIGGLALLWLAAKGILLCYCTILKMCDPVPPYSATDDGLYHREECPYITERNYASDYESVSSAEADGLSPCPHCLE